ncbi:hypothetical protein BGK72_01775 [Streptomyces agglomeratus]|nr:hypothetical protein BGK72_01775 [Streptomyces agglomeratus]
MPVRPSLAVFHLIAQVVIEKDLHVMLVGGFQIEPPHDDKSTCEVHISKHVVQLVLGRVVPSASTGLPP